MEGKTNFSRRLDVRLSGTAIVECLKIVDVGCKLNVSWLDLTLTHDRSTPQDLLTCLGL